MHNIKFIKEFPEKFDACMRKRGIAVNAAQLIRIDELVRLQKLKVESIQNSKNKIAQSIADAKKNGKNTAVLMEDGEQIKVQLLASKTQLSLLEDELHAYLISLPNMPEDDVPYGCDENNNVEVAKYGQLRQFDFAPQEHFKVMERLGQLHTDIAIRMSGSRFYAATHLTARLARAVAALALDIHTTERGYSEVLVPLLVRDKAMFGAGQLPKFEHDSFTVNNNEYRLIPTAEVPLVNMVADSIIQEQNLPLRLVSHTPCFRSEAGSAGRDTHGIIRLHQFYKVELVHICTPQNVEYEYAYMIESAEMVLQRLKLPYRKILLCSQDMGFSAQKTYDLEVWLPGQNKYREVSSCSNCGEFQARRLKARFKSHNGSNHYLHMTNGSALAIERTIAAIMENYQQADGSVTIPEALRPYMHYEEEIKQITKCFS